MGEVVRSQSSVPGYDRPRSGLQSSSDRSHPVFVASCEERFSTDVEVAVGRRGGVVAVTRRRTRLVGHGIVESRMHLGPGPRAAPESIDVKLAAMSPVALALALSAACTTTASGSPELDKATAAHWTPGVASPYRQAERAPLLMSGVGFASFGVLYWGAAMAGAGLKDDETKSAHRVGRPLSFPIVGPFVAAARASNSSSSALVALGVFQALGLGVGITGSVQLARLRREHRARGIRRPQRSYTRVGTGMLVGGVVGVGALYGLSLTMSWSSSHRRVPGRASYLKAMRVPIVGGFIAARDSPSSRIQVGVLTTSMLQVAGLAAATTGAVLLVRGKRTARRVNVSPWGGRGQLGLAASFSF